MRTPVDVEHEIPIAVASLRIEGSYRSRGGNQNDCARVIREPHPLPSVERSESQETPDRLLGDDVFDDDLTLHTKCDVLTVPGDSFPVWRKCCTDSLPLRESLPRIGVPD